MIVPYYAKVVAKPYTKFSLGFDGEAAVCVKVGDTVVPRTIVFEGNESVVLESLNLCNELGVRPDQVPKFLLKGDGEIVDKGEVISRRSVAVGTVERVVKAHESGCVSYARISSGIVDIRSPFAESLVMAGVHGKVIHIYPEHGHRREVVFEVTAYTSAVFEMRGEQMSGSLHFMGDGLSLYRPRDVDSGCSGKVVVAGRSLSIALYDALVAAGARGIIVGGMQKTELSALSKPAVPIAVTEGWGIIPINTILMHVLQEQKDDIVFLDSKKRQLIICPSETIPTVADRGFASESGVTITEVHKGQLVQVWDLPFWGFCGSVVGLLEEEGLVQVEIGDDNKILVSAESLIAIGEE